VGAGFAAGAALCDPGAEIWLILGDGACGYGLTEFDTFVRHGLPVIAVVEQVKILHDSVGTVLARTDYHKVAQGFGAKGILVKTLEQVPAALQSARQAARSGQPVLINVWLDRTEFREGSISM
jgi:acetolactate synthase-1/2/3 large subunit